MHRKFGSGSSSWVLWEFVPLGAIYLLLVIVLASLALSRTGVWVYPLDDTYIHMAIARTFAHTGVWGITPDGYAPATSSPLYTGLLAVLFKIFGPHDLIPFVVNLVAGLACLVVLLRIWGTWGVGKTWRFLLGLWVIFSVTLVHLTLMGMEHTLHLLFIALLFHSILRNLEGERRTKDLVVWGMVAGGIRYETLFLGVVGSLMLWMRGKRKQGVAVTLSVCFVPFLMGIVNLLHGWPFLPTTILVKSLPPQSWTLVERLFYMLFGKLLLNFVRKPELSSLAILFMLFWNRRILPEPLALFLGVWALHMLFASTGWYMRYEAYLVFIGLLLLGRTLFQLERWKRKAEIGWAYLVLLALLSRLIAFPRFPQAVESIALLPYASAMFMSMLPPHTPVAMFDIGLPSYLTRVRVLDVAGLAHKEVAHLRLEGKWEEILPYLVEQEGAKLVVVYEERFPVDRRAYFMGAWEIPSDRWVITGGHRMSVYGVTCKEVREFYPVLKRFLEGLPPRVNTFLVPRTSHPCFLKPNSP